MDIGELNKAVEATDQAIIKLKNLVTSIESGGVSGVWTKSQKETLKIVYECIASTLSTASIVTDVLGNYANKLQKESDLQRRRMKK